MTDLGEIQGFASLVQLFWTCSLDVMGSGQLLAACAHDSIPGIAAVRRLQHAAVAIDPAED